LVFFIVRLIIAVTAAKSSAIEIENRGGKLSDDLYIRGWQDTTVGELIEDIYLLEGLLELAGSDSISLSIDLSDNQVGIQLKGLPLLNSQIIKQFPDKHDLVSHPGFAEVTFIQREKANSSKKPVKKIETAGGKSIKNQEPDSSVYRPLFWEFETGNNMKVIIRGVREKNDSIYRINPVKELALFFAGEFINNIFPSEYKPHLFLWLPDKDAIAIYRALPEKGKIIFSD
jgi:hypothetical protein